MVKIEEGKSYKAANGERVGPMEFWAGNTDRARQEAGDGKYWMIDGTGKCHATGNDLIAEWPEGPVRTVTRREIVPGVYDRVVVRDVVDGNKVIVRLDKDRLCDAPIVTMTADELRSAAMIFSQLAEALDSNEETK